MFILKSKHEEILKAVHFYRYVTVADITRLFFSPSSTNYTGKLLATLAGGKDYQDRQFLYRFPLPQTRSGNTEKIYTLGSKGRAYLTDTLGIEVDWYFRPSDARDISYQQCLHALTLTRFLIAANVYCRDKENISLPEVRTEYELNRQAAYVSLAEHNETIRVKVVPDAWLNFVLHMDDGRTETLPVIFEIDRGSEYQKNFKRHVAARLEFVKRNGAYKQMFGTDAVTIAYLTTASEKHLANIRQWTREVLKEQEKESYTDIFRFCCLQAHEIEPERLFDQPSWFGLRENEPLRLLE